MKRDLSQKVMQLDGKEFDPPQTLQGICFAAVTNPIKGDTESDSAHKLKLYKLAQKIAVGGVVDLTSDDMTLIKDRVCKGYPSAVIYGRVWELLEEKNVAPQPETAHHPV